jgi:ech hydrogenase subunit A
VEALLFLILFPFLAALVLLLVKEARLRAAVVIGSSVLIGAASVWTLIRYGTAGTVTFTLEMEAAGLGMFALELVIAAFLVYLTVKYRKYLALALVLVVAALITLLEVGFGGKLHAVENLMIDQFSIIMVLIIGIIGPLICVYSLRYMDEFHRHHPEVPDRQRTFFFVMFAFLSAMFGLVFSNNLVWFFFFWEITTLASFLLIGYTRTQEATDNAFKALWMNMLGGVGIAIALLYIAATTGQIEMLALITGGQAVALLPAALIGFAGLTKSAQLPFSPWLLGAMVAPTPVSALLHSSTMVKAGVYAIVRFAPVYQNTPPGLLLALVGAATFLITSAVAISQSNAKRVLAYSTIANLGLVVACAGIGTYEAVWAAILLILFHAISKSLLFLSVGTVEHRIHSRDIEDMTGLVASMPRLTKMMLIGMAGMFLAPFGMLISKWAALRAFIDAPLGIIFVIILAFGSAVTVFFWAKWMGKLLAVPQASENIEKHVGRSEWSALYALAGLTVLVCFIFPLVSSWLIEPFLGALYRVDVTNLLGQENTLIMLLMLLALVLLPLSMYFYGRDARHVSAYMGGMTTSPGMIFTGAIGIQRTVSLGNYYLEPYFGEASLMKSGTYLSIALIAVLVATGLALGGMI